MRDFVQSGRISGMARTNLSLAFLLVAACSSPQFEAWQDEHESMQEVGSGGGSGPTEGGVSGGADNSVSDSDIADRHPRGQTPARAPATTTRERG
jgi:hypothetical protein